MIELIQPYVFVRAYDAILTVERIAENVK